MTTLRLCLWCGYLQLLFCQLSFAWTPVFQGRCDDKRSNVLCEQVCIELQDGTFQCGCFSDHVLQKDGYSCRNASSITTGIDRSSSAGKSRRSLDKNSCAFSWCQTGATLPLSPQFSGQSYLKLHAPGDLYLKTAVVLEFYPTSLRGLLLFYGQPYGTDFLSLALLDGHLVFRVNCGEGVVEEIYPTPVKLNAWHRLRASRSECQVVELQLDNDINFAEELGPMEYKGISSADSVYLGGYTNASWTHIQQKVGTASGFVGCVRFLSLNGQRLLDKYANSGDIVEGNEIGNCQLRECDNAACYSGSMCVQDPLIEQGYRCECSFKQRGEFCERSINIETPQLLRDGYLKHRISSDLTHKVELQLEVKPRSLTGLLFYTGNRGVEKYFAVMLKGGYLEVHFNLGGDLATVRSSTAMTIDRWHNVSISRTDRGALLKLDNDPYVEGVAQGEGSYLFTDDYVYLGHVNPSILPRELASAIHRGFQGCISRVVLNGYSFDLVRGADDGNAIIECGRSACASQDQCTGQPCVLTDDSFQCMCHYPLSGTHCEKSVRYSHINALRPAPRAIGFRGTGYLRFSDEQLLRILNGPTTMLSVEFRVTLRTAKSQIILFAGNDTADMDYVQLEVSPNGEVVLTIDLGSGVARLTEPNADAANGQFHVVHVVRDERIVSLRVDNMMPLETVCPGKLRDLNIARSLFIGGFAPSDRSTSDTQGLHGCVNMTVVGSKEQVPGTRLTHPNQASEAVNVYDCT